MTYARRKDNCHNAIGDHLRSLGFSVLDLWRAAGGIPDLLVGKPSFACLVECKEPGKKLTPAEQVVRDRWEGPYIVATSPEDAEKQLTDLYKGSP
jgi:hypothetical protein